MCWYLIIDFKETMQISQMRIRYNLFITGHNKALGHLRNKKKDAISADLHREDKQKPNGNDA